MENKELVEINEEELITKFSENISENSECNSITSNINLKDEAEEDSIDTQDNLKEDEEKEKELKLLQDLKAARLRQQEALNAAAAEYKEKKKLKEEEKIKEKLKEWDLQQQGMSYHGKTELDLASLGLSQRTKLTSKPRLKGDDYNPLTGQSLNSDSGDSCSYRPSRKSENKSG